MSGLPTPGSGLSSGGVGSNGVRFPVPQRSRSSPGVSGAVVQASEDVPERWQGRGGGSRDVPEPSPKGLGQVPAAGVGSQVAAEAGAGFGGGKVLRSRNFWSTLHVSAVPL